MHPLPASPRVVVIGTSAAGKTTFSRTLAERVNASFVELDELHWMPEWRERPDDDFAVLVDKAIAGESWVVDGNYAVVRDLVWPRANVVIWLNYSFPLVFWRGLRRSLDRGLRGQVLWHGNRESLPRAFLSKDSILLWIATTFSRRRAEFAGLKSSGRYPNLRWIEFRKPADADRWLSAMPV